MYYLLKNNRIIDTNNQTFKKEYTSLNGITRYTIETPNEIHTIFTTNGGIFRNYIYTFNSTEIKKQSENVFDLIDKKKDLIKIDSQIIMARTVQGNIKNLSCISAIYKPNSNGDYIKAWEKKDE